jgi:hypothetical protein
MAEASQYAEIHGNFAAAIEESVEISRYNSQDSSWVTRYDMVKVSKHALPGNTRKICIPVLELQSGRYVFCL